jgi:hypothetical protein
MGRPRIFRFRFGRGPAVGGAAPGSLDSAVDESGRFGASAAGAMSPSAIRRIDLTVGDDRHLRSIIC